MPNMLNPKLSIGCLVMGGHNISTPFRPTTLLMRSHGNIINHMVGSSGGAFVPQPVRAAAP